MRTTDFTGCMSDVMLIPSPFPAVFNVSVRFEASPDVPVTLKVNSASANVPALPVAEKAEKRRLPAATLPSLGIQEKPGSRTPELW